MIETAIGVRKPIEPDRTALMTISLTVKTVSRVAVESDVPANNGETGTNRKRPRARSFIGTGEGFCGRPRYKSIPPTIMGIKMSTEDAKKSNETQPYTFLLTTGPASLGARSVYEHCF
jgi:hypothetical protein